MRWPQILNRIPAQRLGDPNGWVGAAVFLACAASSHVHGHAWVMDEVGCLDELEF